VDLSPVVGRAKYSPGFWGAVYSVFVSIRRLSVECFVSTSQAVLCKSIRVAFLALRQVSSWIFFFLEKFSLAFVAMQECTTDSKETVDRMLWVVSK
jgi:prolipoprotein diacylglyceryltransferase